MESGSFEVMIDFPALLIQAFRFSWWDRCWDCGLLGLKWILMFQRDMLPPPSGCRISMSLQIIRTTRCVSPVWTIKASNMSFFLQAPQGPFGQSQQLSNNPSTVLISSTSNSLMSASVKPSTQQIGAIGTKGGGPYQQSALPSAPQPSQVYGKISCTVLAIIISVVVSHKPYFINHSPTTRVSQNCRQMGIQQNPHFTLLDLRFSLTWCSV
jgi:hypothetical protein